MHRNYISNNRGCTLFQQVLTLCQLCLSGEDIGTKNNLSDVGLWLKKLCATLLKLLCFW